MKKLFFFWAVLFFSVTIKAQVSLEHTYNYSATIVQFETLGYKYYLMDVPNAQCRIYHMDHSVFKTINLSIPNGYFLTDVKFLSEKLFDQDSGIELLYTFYKYNTAQGYYEYDSKIIGEEGTELAFIDGSLYNFIQKTGENTWKLFSYCYDFSVSPEKVWTKIFQLPGSPVVTAKAEINDKEYFINAWPNPASGTVKVVYQLPAVADKGTLSMADMTGKTVAEYIVDHHTDFLLIDVNRLKAGMYTYYITYENGRTESRKLAVQ